MVCACNIRMHDPKSYIVFYYTNLKKEVFTFVRPVQYGNLIEEYLKNLNEFQRFLLNRLGMLKS